MVHAPNSPCLSKCRSDYAPLARKQKKFFKPAIQRTPSLCILLAIALGFIALIEYALRVLPQHSVTDRSDLESGYDKRQYDDLVPGLAYPLVTIEKRGDAIPGASPASFNAAQASETIAAVPGLRRAPTTPVETPNAAATPTPNAAPKTASPATPDPNAFEEPEVSTVNLSGPSSDDFPNAGPDTIGAEPPTFTIDENAPPTTAATHNPTAAASHNPGSFTGGEEETISVTSDEPDPTSRPPVYSTRSEGAFSDGNQEETITPIKDPGPSAGDGPTSADSAPITAFGPDPTTIPAAGDGPNNKGYADVP